jgi:hypothetical protein
LIAFVSASQWWWASLGSGLSGATFLHAARSLDLTDVETFALLNLLTETTENDRYPFVTLSPQSGCCAAFSLKYQPPGSLRGADPVSLRWRQTAE